jgi:tRNA 2-thiouridine synthesizing protein A
VTPPQQRSAGAQAPALTLDALGKKCPIPIIMLADRIRDVQIGQTIEVLADDPAAKTDLPAWCVLKSQEFVRTSELRVPPDDKGPAAGARTDVSAPRLAWSFLVRRSY